MLLMGYSPATVYVRTGVTFSCLPSSPTILPYDNPGGRIAFHLRHRSHGHRAEDHSGANASSTSHFIPALNRAARGPTFVAIALS